MKNLIAFGIIFLSLNLSPGIAQKYVIDEDFDNNNNGWDISNTEEATTKISNGKYMANISSGIYWLDRLQNLTIDESRDWVMESEMIKKSGSVGYGLTWGGDNGGGRFNFYITSEKTFTISRWKNYSVTTYYSSTSSTYIKGDGITNKLTVKKVDDKISFYINDNYIAQIENEPFFGKYFGFYGNSGALKIEVDNFKVYYGDNKQSNKKTTSGFVINEEFDNNDNGWDISNTDVATSKISNGKYIANISSGIYWLDRLQNLTIDESRDWVMESEMIKKSGSVGYGLTWGGDNGGGRFNFYITNEKTYTISRWKSYNVTSYFSGTYSSFINADGITNKLTVKKVGEKIKFYINDNYIAQIDNEAFFGKYFGFYGNSGALKIEVDNFKVFYSGDNKQSNKNIPSGFVLNEDFNNNNNSWYEGETDKISATVESGNYSFEHKQEKNSYNAWITINLDEDKNYVLETEIKKVSGIDDNGYGIVWGVKDADNKLEVTLTGNGNYSITKWADGKYEDLVPWTVSSYINKWNGATNKIKIIKDGSYLKLFINDNYVNQVSATSFYGQKIGFTIYKDQKIEVNYIKAYYSGVKEEDNTVINGKEDRQDKSLLGQEAAFVYDFLSIWIDDASNDDKLMEYISPKYLKKNNLNASNYNVNLYYPVNFKIKAYDKENSIVTVLIWGENKKWIHKLTFKVVREDGKLFLYPSQYTTSMYIYPWTELETNVSE